MQHNTLVRAVVLHKIKGIWPLKPLSSSHTDSQLENSTPACI